MNVTEADVVVWTGALAAFAGTFIASPAGTAYVGKTFARHLPFRRHSATVAVGDRDKGTSAESASADVKAVMIWDESAQLEEKVDLLHQ
jgi:hypothetical protein